MVSSEVSALEASESERMSKEAAAKNRVCMAGVVPVSNAQGKRAPLMGINLLRRKNTDSNRFRPDERRDAENAEERRGLSFSLR
jgi:hypothetical protein